MAAAAGAGVAALLRHRPAGEPAGRRHHLDLLTGRGTRGAALAGMGARLGWSHAAYRARRVFAASEQQRQQLDTEHELRTGAQVAAQLGQMKGALMKLGQMASYLDEGLPEPLREALATLQQDAPPMSAALAADVVERELGAPPDRLFARWDEVPLAAASIGQVHRAITRDGLAVAVKVQYPGVDDAIRADLDNSDLLFSVMGMVFPGLDPGPLVNELRARLGEELDYRVEADNQRLFASAYAGHPFVSVPAVVDELSTGRVLTTELAEGARFSEVVSTWTQPERDLAGESIYRFVFRSLYRLRAFNGDPHPGNYLFRPGGRVTFLDFGLVKHFDEPEIDTLQDMIRTLVLNRDIAAYRGVVERAGLLRAGAPVTDEQVYDYFGHFYDLVLEDRVSTFTSEYASETVRRILAARSEFGGLPKWANVPPTFVVLQRINLGLLAVLGALRATANWRRIAEELWPITDGPPATELGRQEHAWLAARPRPA